MHLIRNMRLTDLIGWMVLGWTFFVALLLLVGVGFYRQSKER